MPEKTKVAVSQRVIPHYRVPVFEELSNRENIDLTVFYGKGQKTGASANAEKIRGFRHVRLFTINLSFYREGSSQLRVWHPTLFFHLIFGKYNVVIVEPSTNFYNDIFAFLYCKLFRKKFIWYEAGAEPPSSRSIYRRIIDPLISLFTKKSDAYITYNSFADNYLKQYFNVPDKKIFRAQNALDTNQIKKDFVQFQPQKELKIKELNLENTKIAIFIGGIEKRKKINNLITAISNLNSKGIKSKALIVGDGPDLDWVKSNMKKNEKGHTVFAGRQIEEAVLYILISTVVVLPAQGGLSINHAFACEKPFIGTTECVSGGSSIYDYIIDGDNGFVIEKDNIPALENILEKIFTDEKLYKRLCKGAKRTSEQITIPNMVNGIEKAINYSLLN